MVLMWILPLGQAGTSLEIAGGKGANLARLAAAGFPVPRGFVLVTDAYRAFVARNGLAGTIQAALVGLDAEDPAALETASTSIRSSFAAGRLPPDLAAAIGAAYAALGSPPVAVRSSATAEDLPDLSFAGQQDTLLNVLGAETLLQAVVVCWSSLWTARAIGYRARHGIPHKDLALAVVVQEMAPSEAAGVLFTANPLNGKRTEMVLEATLGLGEALVSGRVEPDRFVVDAASGQILEQSLGSKALSIRPRRGGGTAIQLEEAAGHQALPEEAIAGLIQLGRQAGELFGLPQDVEWAWAGNQVYVLQSRPITALFPLPLGMKSEPLRVLFSFGAVQGLIGPMTPLGQDSIRSLFAGAAGLFGYRLTAETQKLIYSAGERLFIEITAMVRNRAGQRVLRAALGFLEPGIQAAMTTLWDDPRLGITGSLKLGTLRRIVPVLVPLAYRQILSLLKPQEQRASFERDLERATADAETRMAGTTTLSERVLLMEEMLDGTFRFLLPRFVPRFGAGMFSLTLLHRLAAGVPDGEHDVLTMTRGLPQNVTTEMDLALWQAVRQIQGDAIATAHIRGADAADLAGEYLTGQLPESAQSAVAGFLTCYGARGVGEIDLGQPRWREDPTSVMQALHSYLQIENPDQAPDRVFARGAAAANQAVERLAESVRRTRGGWLKARLVHWAARRMRTLTGLRESPKFWAVRLMGLVRAALLHDGEALADAGVLDRSDDLFFLRLDELHSLGVGEERNWAALVNERRRAYDREERRSQVPRLLLSDGQAFYEGVPTVDEERDRVLAGSPVSPGLVDGPVRVILDPRTANLAPGEILVCPGTDPAWTPLFLVAAGLIMEMGGLMTHGSVVAREYGIPAVVGVSQATTRLKTGQRVRVDGSTGQVTLL
jgi:phosphohistidine swiveling domain-containing protein